MKNHFDLYKLPISFLLDEAELQRTFYANSKKFHPDFYTHESEEKQAEILELSSQNNEAYKILKDFDRRMKYILDLKGTLAEEGQNKIPQDFLMEMMEINEQLMELEFDFDADNYEKVKSALQKQEDTLYATLRPLIEQYDDTQATPATLEAIKEYYLKKRYLLRISENLNKFAPH